MRLGLGRTVARRGNPSSSSILPSAQLIRSHARYQSTTPASSNGNGDELSATADLSPRWLSDVRTRIGKCIMFGLSPEQTKDAGSILQEIAVNWRELVAGSEGFLTEQDRRGLYRREVVWGEMDSMTARLVLSQMNPDCVTGHVNNVMYNRYAESARVNWCYNFANAIDPAHKTEWMELLTPKSIGLILRSIKTDYKFPMKYPDRITVLHKLRTPPSTNTDHFILDVLILSELHRRPAARCVEDIVVYDYALARKAPLPTFMLDRFVETWELQEAAKRRYGKRVRELLDRVRGLETGSWDRVDAKEDFGSAG